ncbi:MAG TPA: heavy metal-binding domain-containing protein [Sulfurovum sp.]|uniref:heavy metal-binding domain-containing protein n=1 Tax=Sulfurovum sp. TaxID=1969726 RepID=UPI002F93ED1B
MTVTTTETLPEHMKIRSMFSMIEITHKIQISQKGLIKGFLQRKRDEHQEALDKLIESAPAEANAIIGVKHSTATHTFPEGTFLFITYIGTPVVIEDKKV